MAESRDQPSPPALRQSGRVIPQKLTWQKRLIASAGYCLIRIISATLRYEWHYHPWVWERNSGPAIFCVWHNRLALSLMLYRNYRQRLGQAPRMAAMVSASKDGAVVARVLEHFGVQPVRGSSSRRGPQALLEMITWAEKGYDLSVTPDGPRGPRYVVQEGVIYLAQLTGLPIIPASYQLGWKISAKSWDRFQIPLPFSRVVARIGEPIQVPREAPSSDREALRLEVENAIKNLAKD